MASASWPPELITKMAKDIFQHYDSDQDGFLQHAVRALFAKQSRSTQRDM